MIEKGIYPYLKKRFKICDDQILELVKHPDYQEMFDDYESMFKQFEQFKSDRSLYQINQELIAELEEEISIVLSNYTSENI